MNRNVMITGAAGGMGRACTRVFGTAQNLILTDVAEGPLVEFSEQLRAEGYQIKASVAGDLANDGVLSQLASHLNTSGPFTLIHTAGVSPSQADWQTIIKVNLVATEKLLQVFDTRLTPGAVAIVLASIAGHMMPVIAEAQLILKEPLALNMIDRLDPLLRHIASQGGAGDLRGVCYSLSKQAVLALCERRAAVWGRQGARIVTISPGLISTPMGRKELAETAGAAQLRDMTPAGRVGTPMDIALVAQFLASESASYITGTDIRVDGGTVAALKGV